VFSGSFILRPLNFFSIAFLRFTFNYADAAAASRTWNAAYLDYLESQGEDITNNNSEEFWANELALKDTDLRKKAGSAAETYVSTNLMESGSKETPSVYKTPLLNIVLPFTKYILGKSSTMGDRIGVISNPKATYKEKTNALRQLTADSAEIYAFTIGVKQLILQPMSDMLVRAYLESAGLEPEDDEDKLRKKERTRKGFGMIDFFRSSSPVPAIIILSNIFKGHEAKMWNNMLENMYKEDPDQPTSKFREETDAPVVPEIKSQETATGLFGIASYPFPRLTRDWRYLEEDGSKYIEYEDMKGDKVKKPLTDEEAEVLDNAEWITLWSLIGAKDAADVLRQAENEISRKAKQNK